MKNVFEQETIISQWDDDYYHPIALPLYDRAIRDMIGLLGAAPGDTILDGGCGPGVHSIRAAKAGLRVCAVDLSESMLAHARQRSRAEGVADAIEFHQGDLTRLAFADASFRFGFSWGVVTHIPDAGQALDELARVIQPGGRLALYLINKTGADVLLKTLARFVLRRPLAALDHLPLGDRMWSEKDGGRLCVWAFDAAALTAHLERRGLRLVERRLGELSELQRHFTGLPRRSLLHLNNLAYRLSLPPSLAVGNLFVFEK
jgi:ubiquinone/menaquinone biosynthesis C-methylase UbiE